jgi:hypothetical protein
MQRSHESKGKTIHCSTPTFVLDLVVFFIYQTLTSKGPSTLGLCLGSGHMAASSVGNAMGWPNVGTAGWTCFHSLLETRILCAEYFFSYDISKADSGIRFGILTGKYK